MASRNAKQVEKIVNEMQCFSAEKAKKEIDKAKEALCSNCTGHQLMKLVPDGADGTHFSWICEVCELTAHSSDRSNVLKAFRKLGHKIL